MSKLMSIIKNFIKNINFLTSFWSKVEGRLHRFLSYWPGTCLKFNVCLVWFKSLKIQVFGQFLVVKTVKIIKNDVKKRSFLGFLRCFLRFKCLSSGIYDLKSVQFLIQFLFAKVLIMFFIQTDILRVIKLECNNLDIKKTTF